MSEAKFYDEKLKEFKDIYERFTNYMPFIRKEDLIFTVSKSVMSRLKDYIHDMFKIEKELVKECFGVEIVEIDEEMPRDIYVIPRSFLEKLLKEREEKEWHNKIR